MKVKEFEAALALLGFVKKSGDASTMQGATWRAERSDCLIHIYSDSVGKLIYLFINGKGKIKGRDISGPDTLKEVITSMQNETGRI